MTTEVATTGFAGADVDGLDRLAHEFTQAARICDEVKMACEVIVAAASIFGPFGAAFVAYLKGTVIPWLTTISHALTAMAKVLSLHSLAQKDASSGATSLPSYTSPGALPQTSTTNYPTLPGAVGGSATGATGTPVTTPGASTVTAPPSIGGATGAAGTVAGIPAGTPGGTTPAVQAITALTGLVTAVDHLIHPGATDATPVTPGSVPSITSVGGGSLNGGVDLAGLQPLHPGDTVGVVSVPVDIAPDGTITPLGHLPGSGAGPAVPVAPAAVPASPPHVAPLTTTAHLPGSSGGGPASGGGIGGGSGPGGYGGASPVSPVAAPAHAVTAAHIAPAHAAGHTIGQTAALGTLTSSAPGASHDGLYSGLGQATGIGAGGAALARATLHEARQRAEGLLGAVSLPSDSAADAVVRARVLDGELR